MFWLNRSRVNILFCGSFWDELNLIFGLLVLLLIVIVMVVLLMVVVVVKLIRGVNEFLKVVDFCWNVSWCVRILSCFC